MALLATEQRLLPLHSGEPRDQRYMLFGPSATAAQIAFVEPMVWRMPAEAACGRSADDARPRPDRVAAESDRADAGGGR